MKNLPKELFKLLSLHSPSGQEGKVIKYVLPHLKRHLDSLWQDSYGNLLGEVKMGSDPYTVLLSAHMDTVASIQPKPTWRAGREIYTQSKSALGGDDKCGIAAILAILRNLHTTSYSGTVKVIFSKEEEMGCIGAYEAVRLNPKWFDGINASVVIDRRGSDNIVTGAWTERFCSDEYGEFWVDMAKKLGFKGIVQDGTISDTMVFSEIGINGVNLSAGYYNAHTNGEFIKVDEIIRTAKWVLTALDHIQGYGDFPSFEYYIQDSKTVSSGGWWNSKDEDVVYKDNCDYCWKEIWEDELYLVEKAQVCGACLKDLGYEHNNYVTVDEYHKAQQTV